MKNTEDYSQENITKIVKNSLIFKKIPGFSNTQWFQQIIIGTILWATFALSIYAAYLIIW